MNCCAFCSNSRKVDKTSKLEGFVINFLQVSTKLSVVKLCMQPVLVFVPAI